MSVKHSNTTSDYIEWDAAINLIHKLYRDGDFRMSLLVGCGIFFGTRISDTLQLTWAMLLDDDRFELIEKKTKKRREIKINNGFQKHIKDCFKALKITDKSEHCFISRKNTVFSTQRINAKVIHIFISMFTARSQEQQKRKQYIQCATSHKTLLETKIGIIYLIVKCCKTKTIGTRKRTYIRKR